MNIGIIKMYIAERKLLYSKKDSSEQKEFSIRISKPFVVEKNMATSPIKEGFVGCNIEIIGLDEEYPTVYGTDSLQAVNLASNMEPFLKRLQKKYDIFWADGNPYF